VRRKRLGIELRRLREQAGLTCEQVGEQLECSGNGPAVDVTNRP
jgi:hypothetical protein